ncbi:MAG: hypothetical protein HDR09_05265 [Lachnospiraceae bacterium]|nr:hypothetical protein [Lachnospiraceae bacterium]
MSKTTGMKITAAGKVTATKDATTGSYTVKATEKDGSGIGVCSCQRYAGEVLFCGQIDERLLKKLYINILLYGFYLPIGCAMISVYYFDLYLYEEVKT